jgi:hypothetical protein
MLATIEHGEHCHVVQQNRLRDLEFRGPSWTACFICLIGSSSSKIAAQLCKLGSGREIAARWPYVLSTPSFSLLFVPHLRKVPFNRLKDRIPVTHFVEGHFSPGAPFPARQLDRGACGLREAKSQEGARPVSARTAA